MSNEMTRREFLERSAVAATVAGGLAGKARGAESPATSSQAGLSPPTSNGLLLGGTAALSKPLPVDCQLAFRIGLAQQRTTSLRNASFMEDGSP